MKIDFTQEIKTLDGKSLPYNENKKTLLKDVSCDALLAQFNDERDLPGEEKCKRWLLATRIYSNPQNIDLTVEEIVLVKKIIGKAYPPLVVGQSWNYIEGKETDDGKHKTNPK